MNEPKHQDMLLTREQAANFLGCKPNTLALWKCNKRYVLPCVKIGRNVRYRMSDLQDFIERNIC
jgi:predicted DNA-binding transcriptional regulator AlpA